MNRSTAPTLDMHTVSFPMQVKWDWNNMRQIRFKFIDAYQQRIGNTDVEQTLRLEETNIIDANGRLQYRIVNDGVLPLGNESIVDAKGHPLGHMTYHVVTSFLTKAHFDVFADNNTEKRICYIQENSLLLRWARRIAEWDDDWPDLVASWIGNPGYTLKNAAGKPLAKIKREGSITEGVFTISKINDDDRIDSGLVFCALVNVCLYEVSSE